MKNIFVLIPLALLLVKPNILAQEAKEKGLDAITAEAIKGQLSFLSSDWTEGRHTGRPGAYLAADYLASLFSIYGIQPGGDMERTSISRAEWSAGKRPVEYRGYYQNFELIEYKPGDTQKLSLVQKTAWGSNALNFDYLTDFSVSTSDVAQEIDAPVVFVGYGFRDEESGYDDFKGVDVEGKIILRLSGYPGYNDEESAASKKIGKKNYREIRTAKSEAATEHGVAAIIEVVPGRDITGNWADNLPFRYNQSDYEGDVPRKSYYEYRMNIPGDLSASPARISISKRVKDKLLEGTGIDLEAFEKEVSESAKPASKELTGKQLKLITTVDSRVIQVRNVVGVIPGKDTSEIIVVGGHYDHLGMHDGYIWNGADDNASGTVGVMTIAKAMMAAGEKPEKTIVFAAWTGEEKGLLGSEYFADHPYDDAEVILNLNYDMISRDDADDTLGIRVGYTYTEKYSILEEVAEANNATYDLGLEVEFEPSERPRGGSDYSSFSSKDIPVIAMMAGFPPEYHRPGDHIELVNWEKMQKIIELGYLTIFDLANMDWKE
ncbi:M20/M25/M40 family metallo-hydrolase [Bacteroidota bacterium]